MTPFGAGRRDMSGARKLIAAAVAAALLVTIAFAAVAASRGGAAGDDLLAQAAEPQPIAVRLLTERATFVDGVTLDLGIALEDGEPIAMSVAEPGRSVVAEITVQPGAAFPWHTHPGPIFVNVASGELVYVPASDCRERHYLVGNVFVDPGRGNVHTAYNASDEVTVLIATFFEVPEEGPLTITEGVEAPEGCDVQVSAHDH